MNELELKIMIQSFYRSGMRKTFPRSIIGIASEMKDLQAQIRIIELRKYKINKILE